MYTRLIYYTMRYFILLGNIIILFKNIECNNFGGAYLGDICSQYVPCAMPNSKCQPTDNIFWDRQSFCICDDNFEPSTGHCIEIGTDDGYIPDEQQLRMMRTTTTITTTTKQSSSSSMSATATTTAATTTKPAQESDSSKDQPSKDADRVSTCSQPDNSPQTTLVPYHQQPDSKTTNEQIPAKTNDSTNNSSSKGTMPKSWINKMKSKSSGNRNDANSKKHHSSLNPIYEPPFPEATTAGAEIVPTTMRGFNETNASGIVDTRFLKHGGVGSDQSLTFNGFLAMNAPTRPPHQHGELVDREPKAVTTSAPYTLPPNPDGMYDLVTFTQSPYDMQTPPPTTYYPHFKKFEPHVPQYRKSAPTTMIPPPARKRPEYNGENGRFGHISLDQLLAPAMKHGQRQHEESSNEPQTLPVPILPTPHEENIPSGSAVKSRMSLSKFYKSRMYPTSSSRNRYSATSAPSLKNKEYDFLMALTTAAYPFLKDRPPKKSEDVDSVFDMFKQYLQRVDHQQRQKEPKKAIQRPASISDTTSSSASATNIKFSGGSDEAVSSFLSNNFVRSTTISPSIVIHEPGLFDNVKITSDVHNDDVNDASDKMRFKYKPKTSATSPFSSADRRHQPQDNPFMTTSASMVSSKRPFMMSSSSPASGHFQHHNKNYHFKIISGSNATTMPKKTPRIVYNG